jgi:hypothetical protein
MSSLMWKSRSNRLVEPKQFLPLGLVMDRRSFLRHPIVLSPVSPLDVGVVVGDVAGVCVDDHLAEIARVHWWMPTDQLF